jgi:hypothetical protein
LAVRSDLPSCRVTPVPFLPALSRPRAAHLLRLVLAVPNTALLGLALSGCGSDVRNSGLVQPPEVSSQVAQVVVSPNSALLRIGDTLTLSASTRDVGGAPLLGRRVTWSSEFPALVAVSGTGVVTALTAGSVRVTASSEGATGTASLTVTR